MTIYWLKHDLMRRGEIEIDISSRHIPLFAAHKHLATFLRDYYHTSIYYEREGSYSITLDTFCSYSLENIKLLASLGITERMPVRERYRKLAMNHLIYSYYSSKFICDRFNKALIGKDEVLAFKKVNILVV